MQLYRRKLPVCSGTKRRILESDLRLGRAAGDKLRSEICADLSEAFEPTSDNWLTES